MTNVITESDIKETLINHYSGRGGPDRELVVNQRADGYGDNTGSIVYSLVGSPPKGYAIAIPELREVHYYDNHGKRFLRSENTVVEGAEPYQRRH